MNILRYSANYIRRNTRKVLLLFFALLILSLCLIICITLKNGADAELERMGQVMTSSVTVKIDNPVETSAVPRKNMMGLTQDNVNEILGFNHVKGCFGYTIWPGAYINGLELKNGNYTYMYNYSLSKDGKNGARSVNTDYYRLMTSTVYMFGCNDSGEYEAFRNGAFELIEGRHVNQNDVNTVVISENVAERNGLKVGDILPVELRCMIAGLSENPDANYGSSEPIEVEIVGIYKLNFAQPDTYDYSDDGLEAKNNNGTKIYYTNTGERDFAESLIFFDLYSVEEAFHYLNVENGVEDTDEAVKVDPRFDDVTFFADSVHSLESIIDDIKQMDTYDPEYYYFEIYDTGYEGMEPPLYIMSFVSLAVAATAYIAAIIILILLTEIWVSGRRDEIRVLNSIGIGKPKIAGQFIVEAVFIAAVASIIAVLASIAFDGIIEDVFAALFSDKGDGAQYDYYILSSSMIDSAHALADITQSAQGANVDIVFDVSVKSALSTVTLVVLGSVAAVAIALRKHVFINRKRAVRK